MFLQKGMPVRAYTNSRKDPDMTMIGRITRIDSRTRMVTIENTIQTIDVPLEYVIGRDPLAARLARFQSIRAGTRFVWHGAQYVKRFEAIAADNAADTATGERRTFRQSTWIAVSEDEPIE